MNLKITPRFLFLMMALATLLNFSCRKIDLKPDVEAVELSSTNDVASQFFNSHESSDKTVKAIQQKIFNQNERKPFVEKFVKYAGFPVWNKAIVTSASAKIISSSLRNDANSTARVVYIPLALDSQQNVNSILKATITATDTVLSMLYHWQYKKFGYGESDTTNNANETALLFMGFENYVFGHSEFKLKDSLLFRENDTSGTATKIKITSFNKPGANQLMQVNTITVCYVVVIYDPPPIGTYVKTYIVPCHCHTETQCSNYNVWVETGGGGYTGSGGDSGGNDGGGSGGGGGYSGDWEENPCDSPPADPTEMMPLCDDIPQGWEPVEPVLIEDEPINLNTLLNLNNEQSLWIANNPEYSNTIFEEILLDNYSEESKTIAKIIIDQGTNNLLDANWDVSFGNIAYPHVKFLYDQCCPGLLTPLNPSSWGIKWANETKVAYAINRFEHPEWGKVKCLYEAIQESIHTALDVAGLVPVVGEVFDLANGILYTIQGDGLNATLSITAAIPVVGTWTTIAKWTKKTIVALDGTKRTLKWVQQTNNIIKFGDRDLLRKVLGLAKGDARKAHHLIPWEHGVDELVQKAASKNFHLNEILNGMPLTTIQHNGSHALYNQKVKAKLANIVQQGGGINNFSPEFAAQKVREVVSQIRSWIVAHPNESINNIVL